ncbi:hypothetical protein I553_9296 [Mycobacterium xenopi 4042]|uniref:Winged helix DNA-binding domain protein n=1 Tax=Mycobacterium xenopi 4042 TaxID=1299334 RepID=X8DZY3_MYCXE|nr:hypothetical protein I553_9296 [Mycobacterium xenopi 4042]
MTVLQAVRLKGQVTATDLAVTLGADPAEVADTVERLAAAGLVEGDKVLKLSRDGRTRLGELLAEERKNIDEAALLAAYNDFRAVNADFKAAVTDWQLKDGEANTHQDAEYDAAVLAASPTYTNGCCRSSPRPPRNCPGSTHIPRSCKMRWTRSRRAMQRG